MKTRGNSCATAAAMATTALMFAPPVVFSALFAALSGGHSTSPPSMLDTEMMRMLEVSDALSEKVSLDSVTLLGLHFTSLQVEKAAAVLQAHQGKNEKK